MGIPWSFSKPQILPEADRSLLGFVFFSNGVAEVKQSHMKFHLANWKLGEEIVASQNKAQALV